MRAKQILTWIAVGLIGSLIGAAGCNKPTPPESTVSTAGDKSTAGDNSTAVDEVEATLTDSTGEEEAKVIEPLEIGDPAPGLRHTEWIRGDEIAEFEPGKVHVVEFWATWCPPCRASMPHLSKLQDEYASDVKFVGFSDETVDIVEEFLAKPSEADSSRTWNEVVTYALALDQDREMHDMYLAATNQRGIPTAYIVGREGHLLWHGHPMTMDGPLSKIVANEWTQENAAEQMAEVEAAEEARRQLQERMSAAQEAEDWDEALAAFEQLVADPEVAAMFGNHVLAKRYELLCRAGRTDEANDVSLQLKEAIWDDAEDLHSVTWMIIQRIPETSHRDLDFALVLGERANELTSGEDPQLLSMIARGYFEQDDPEKAVTWQEKVLEASAKMGVVSEADPAREVLAEYQAALDEKLGIKPADEDQPTPADETEMQDDEPEMPADEAPTPADEAPAPEAEAEQPEPTEDGVQR